MPNIVIIGSGPAGVSAALYTARAGVETTVLTKGPGALDRAAHIQNYYGFAEPISGAELERRGIEGARALGVQFVTTEAVGLTYTDKLTVETMVFRREIYWRDQFQLPAPHRRSPVWQSWKAMV